MKQDTIIIIKYLMLKIMEYLKIEKEFLLLVLEKM